MMPTRYQTWPKHSWLRSCLAKPRCTQAVPMPSSNISSMKMPPVEMPTAENRAQFATYSA